MFDQFLIAVNQWMSGGLVFAAAGAFAWGMVSVLFSPCHLASIPLIVAYVGGQETAVHPRRAGWYAGAFSLGHCLPIVVAGSSAALVRRLTESSAWQGAGLWFRRGAGVVIALLGIYFMYTPFTGGI
jgi:cytochrome c-type biogenesis protein